MKAVRVCGRENKISLEWHMASGFQGAGTEDLDIYPMILHNPKCSGAVEGTLERETSTRRPSSQTLPAE